MSADAQVNPLLPEAEQYQLLLRQVKEFITPDEPLLTVLANVCALLKEAFPKVSWCGFYLFDGSLLRLGPFQGRVACTQIQLGSGVCGTAAQSHATVIVPDVHVFPGHIACDAGSNSEIVVPLLNNGVLLGVLDLDSYAFSAFTQADAGPLQEICSLIAGGFSPTAFNNVVTLKV